ncbi:hypothetical protein LXA43DRAFT_997051 [Ganoderma leucocontextum]|nr:hypothetical protein LXA43DRAFT_997051 [Ganoderma leucocontextum]
MSQTSTVPQTRTAISRSSSILLSPSKRRKLDDEQPRHQAPQSERRNAPPGGPQGVGNSEQSQPTPTELYRWTFTRAAITPCFVRDVFEMKASGFRDMEFFWLGRIPCRTVRLMGLLVGVTVWDRRTMYTIDDGTAVLDCAFAHAQAVPPSPVKPKPKVTVSACDSTKRTGPSFSDYLFSARKIVPPTTLAPPSRAEPPPAPKPIAPVGQSVRIVGRVVSRYDTRILLVDEISPCASYNEEPNHWLTVSELHCTTYHPSEVLPPFVPPPLPTESGIPPYSRPGSPSKRAATQQPTTPASVRFTVPSANPSPGTSVATSSPASSTAADTKQIRLRHPSRLHTRDLTANTFRIYIKHYMDNAPPPSLRHRRSEARSVSPSPTPRASRSRADDEDTPTKSRGTKRGARADATPHPSRRRRLEGDHTPRASLVSEAETDTDSESNEEDKPEADDQMYGFTLSHLRRIPELSLLARRAIAADSHRREKEERKKAKAQPSQLKDKGKAPASSSTSRPSETQAPTGAAVKKLFKQAIRTLFQEGDIVLWSGPVRPLPAPPLDPMLPASSSCALWRANTSTSSAISSASTSSRSRPSYEEWDDDEVLSDPQPNEEAYVPLTPAYFSRVLEDAIRRMVCEKLVKMRGAEGGGEATPKPKSATKSIIERLRAQEKERERGVALPPGPTKEELLAWLRNSDERWARVGDWTVQEALEWGRREGRLWFIGKGRWEVCG